MKTNVNDITAIPLSGLANTQDPKINVTQQIMSAEKRYLRRL